MLSILIGSELRLRLGLLLLFLLLLRPFLKLLGRGLLNVGFGLEELDGGGHNVLDVQHSVRPRGWDEDDVASGLHAL